MKVSICKAKQLSILSLAFFVSAAIEASWLSALFPAATENKATCEPIYFLEDKWGDWYEEDDECDEEIIGNVLDNMSSSMRTSSCYNRGWFKQIGPWNLIPSDVRGL